MGAGAPSAEQVPLFQGLETPSAMPPSRPCPSTSSGTQRSALELLGASRPGACPAGTPEPSSTCHTQQETHGVLEPGRAGKEAPTHWLCGLGPVISSFEALVPSSVKWGQYH